MRISYLQEFTDLATSLSFTKVAAARHLSRSSLSKHIATLEEQLGCQLFLRDTNNVELTPDGRVFYEAISPSLSELDEAITTFKSRRGRRAESYTVGVCVSDSTLLRRLADFKTSYEKMNHGSLVFKSVVEKDYLSTLENGSVDALLVYATKKVTERGFTAVPLFRTPMVAIVTGKKPLAKRECFSIQDDSHDVRLVRLNGPFFSAGWDTIESVFQNYDVKPRFVYSMAADPSELAFINTLDDVLLYPESGLRNIPFLTTEEFAVLPVREQDACFTLSVVYDAGRSNPGLHELVQEASKSLKKD